jgi:glucose-1-phosphate cytidylyltransferase
MKVVILAGGLGTRLSEETGIRPKPMVEIGGKPIIWHIMKFYSSFGYNDFIICTGYKGYMIKEYFHHYFQHIADVTINFRENRVEYHNKPEELWNVSLVDTGLHNMTGSRIKQVRDYVGNERFMLTYGDGLSDVDLDKLLEFHIANGKLVTLTSVQPAGRFGALKLDDDNKILSFQEKLKGDGSWINGGFFVVEPGAFDYIGDGPDEVWERNPLESLARDGQLMAYRHHGFWKPMDTIRDKIELEALWDSGDPPWMRWKSKSLQLIY